MKENFEEETGEESMKKYRVVSLVFVLLVLALTACSQKVANDSTASVEASKTTVSWNTVLFQGTIKAPGQKDVPVEWTQAEKFAGLAKVQLKTEEKLVEDKVFPGCEVETTTMPANTDDLGDAKILVCDFK